jgi:hypothetical protein
MEWNGTNSAMWKNEETTLTLIYRRANAGLTVDE